MEKLVKELSNYNGENQVKIIGFITKPDDGVKYPIPTNYLSGVPTNDEVPSELIEEMKSVAWSDAEGTIWFPEGFRPTPVKGSDGDVYLAVGSDTMEDEVMRDLVMTDAMSLLNDNA